MAAGVIELVEGWDGRTGPSDRPTPKLGIRVLLFLTTSVQYDADGPALNRTDRNNTTTFYSLDSDGQVTQVQVALRVAAALTEVAYVI